MASLKRWRQPLPGLKSGTPRRNMKSFPRLSVNEPFEKGNLRVCVRCPSNVLPRRRVSVDLGADNLLPVFKYCTLLTWSGHTL